MKKLIYLSILLFSIASCNSLDLEKDNSCTNTLCTGEWVQSSILTGGQIEHISWHFNNNGSLQMATNGNSVNGTWRLGSWDVEIIFIDDGSVDKKPEQQSTRHLFINVNGTGEKEFIMWITDSESTVLREKDNNEEYCHMVDNKVADDKHSTP